MTDTIEIRVPVTLLFRVPAGTNPGHVEKIVDSMLEHGSPRDSFQEAAAQMAEGASETDAELFEYDGFAIATAFATLHRYHLVTSLDPSGGFAEFSEPCDADALDHARRHLYGDARILRLSEVMSISPAGEVHREIPIPS